MNQRLCPVPDGDLFGAIRDGRATVVTDRIERFTRPGRAWPPDATSRPMWW